jgi:hypothetical protein
MWSETMQTSEIAKLVMNAQEGEAEVKKWNVVWNIRGTLAQSKAIV